MPEAAVNEVGGCDVSSDPEGLQLPLARYAEGQHGDYHPVIPRSVATRDIGWGPLDRHGAYRRPLTAKAPGPAEGSLDIDVRCASWS